MVKGFRVDFVIRVGITASVHMIRKMSFPEDGPNQQIGQKRKNYRFRKKGQKRIFLDPYFPDSPGFYMLFPMEPIRIIITLDLSVFVRASC